jgi:hypothetical protein
MIEWKYGVYINTYNKIKVLVRNRSDVLTVESLINRKLMVNVNFGDYHDIIMFESFDEYLNKLEDSND